MKTIFNCLLFLCIYCQVSAQKIDDIASKEIDMALPLFENRAEFKNIPEVKLLGLGDVGTFAKESKKFNTSFSAYLITRKDFRNIALHLDDWIIRPLNAYLTNSTIADSQLLDSLIKTTFSSDYQFKNEQFRSFLVWVKAYNIKHPLDMVQIFGVAPASTIPPSYFLATYIYEIDAASGKKMSEKWTNTDSEDSIKFLDVKNWMAKLNDTKMSKEHQRLILQCNEDLASNEFVLKYTAVIQKFSQKELNNRFQFIAKQISKRLDKKTIYYTSNVDVSKADFESNLVFNNLSVSSVGKYLNDDLKEQYYACVTDFADVADLLVLDIATKNAYMEKTVASEHVKSLYRKHDYFDRNKDFDLLKGYSPIIISPLKQQVTRIIVEKNQYAIDALFLFSVLSQTDIFQ